MIVVDTSVWIAHLRNEQTLAARRLRAQIDPDDILVGDLILLELLQGARDEHSASAVEGHLRQFELATMCDVDTAVAAASNYRVLRSKGITVRKSIDLLIGTFCIRHGHHLLQQDRDFEPMARHLGLKLA